MTRDVTRLVRWAHSLPDTTTLDLSCAEGPALGSAPGHELVQLDGCLQDCTPGELLEVAAAAPRVLLRLDGCRRRGTSPDLAAALSLVDAFGLTHRLDSTHTGPAGTGPGGGGHTSSALPPSRRQLLGWLARPPADPGDRGLPPEGPLPGPSRTLAALRTMGGRASGSSPDSPSLALRSRGCTACDTCVRVCPTDALSLDGDGDTRRLILRPGRCVGCRECLTLCPAQALDDAGPVPWGGLLDGPEERVLEDLVVRRCEKCRTVFAGGSARGGSSLCQTCAMRRTEPFGSWLPPGFSG